MIIYTGIESKSVYKSGIGRFLVKKKKQKNKKRTTGKIFISRSATILFVRFIYLFT